eukprot:TRINITY_DN1953_c1_g2_i2.p1 TRINITY_DN1953_c1_g2~~TRINITY_DN1953_c1_g2_i2.p1  ORF type:complete len:844 (+),score=221.83 TRINITY_DN1953_c1_g2_i2:180-2534(+)
MDSNQCKTISVLRTAMGRPAGCRVRNTGFVRHCYRLHVKTGFWSMVVTDVAPFVAHHAAATVGHEVYVFGGVGLTRKTTNALKVLDCGVKCYYCSEPGYAQVPLETCQPPGSKCSFTFDQLTKLHGQDKAEALWSSVPPNPLPTNSADLRPPKHKCPLVWVCDAHLREQHDGVSFRQRYGTYHWRTVEAAGEVPPPRHSHTMVKFNSELIVFGGVGGTPTPSEQLDGPEEPLPEAFLPADTYSFCTLREVWTKLETNAGPAPRYGHAAAVCGAHMLVSGGCVGQLRGSVGGWVSNEVWLLDLYNQTWRKLAAPGVPRLKHHTSTVLNNVDGVAGPALVLTGGWHQEHDTWQVGENLVGEPAVDLPASAVPEAEEEFASDPPFGPVVKTSQGWFVACRPKHAAIPETALKTAPLPPGCPPGVMAEGGDQGARTWLGPLTTSIRSGFGREKTESRRVIELGEKTGMVGAQELLTAGRPKSDAKEPALFFDATAADDEHTAILEYMVTNETWVIPLLPVEAPPPQPVHKRLEEMPPLPPDVDKMVWRLHGEEKKKLQEGKLQSARELRQRDAIAGAEPRIKPTVDWCEKLVDAADEFQGFVAKTANVPKHIKLSGNPTKFLTQHADEARKHAGRLKEFCDSLLRRTEDAEATNDEVPHPARRRGAEARRAAEGVLRLAAPPHRRRGGNERRSEELEGVGPPEAPQRVPPDDGRLQRVLEGERAAARGLCGVRTARQGRDERAEGAGRVGGEADQAQRRAHRAVVQRDACEDEAEEGPGDAELQARSG